jgi:hypothetical protein
LTSENDDFDLDAAPLRRSDATGCPTPIRPMSRRHQGGRPHRSGGHGRPSAAPLAAPSAESQRYRPETIEPARPEPAGPPAEGLVNGQALVPFTPAPASPDQVQAQTSAPTADVLPPAPVSSADARGQLNRPGLPFDNGHGPSNGATCTAPQLRRFIKSRPYVPMHELRRRFAINGDDDDVTAVDLAGGRVFVGLPAREGDLLGELLRGGEVGYELSLDPRSPIVVGLYPMRPIPRS